jgi:hypothetical protein
MFSSCLPRIILLTFRVRFVTHLIQGAAVLRQRLFHDSPHPIFIVATTHYEVTQMLKFSTIHSRLWLSMLIAVLIATLIGTQSALAARTCTIRYYVSPMVGSGTEEDPIRPLVIDLPNYPKRTYATAWEMVYNGDRQPYALVVVASTNHRRLLKNDEIGILPDIPLETSIFDLTGEEASMIMRVISGFGMDPEVMDESTTYYEVLYRIAGQIDFFNNPGVPTLDTCPLK